MQKHFIYHEVKRGLLWIFTGKAPCDCYINEDHWVERIV